MRHVALIFAALTLAAALPATAAPTFDDCPEVPVPSKPCVRVDTRPTGMTPPDGKPRTYYVYAAVLACAPSFESTCAGRPTEGGMGFAGLVYEESNGYPGLQRFAFYALGTFYDPDTTVLV